MPNTAVILCIEEKELAGRPCFDVRFDTQKVPQGAYVVGFLVYEEGGVKELISPGYMTQEQKENWQTALNFARAVLRGEDSSTLEVELEKQLRGQELGFQFPGQRTGRGLGI